MDHSHKTTIAEIVGDRLGTECGEIIRMSNGICNEVYRVGTKEGDVIFRLHTAERYILGSHNHIPIFQSLGIRVPEILAEDYSKSKVPFAFQILSLIEGRDINDVIAVLTDEQLVAIAGEIANVFVKLRDVPNNGKFGVLWGDGNDLQNSWAADIERMTSVVMRWGTKTGLLDAEFEGILCRINSEYKSYFESVEPITYFGDICAKNVMIHEGRFSGLVDLDSLAQGDPLEAVGRIKASWHGTRFGCVYTDAVMDTLGLDQEQRDLVLMYALLNRTYWTFENGVQFNQNTRPVVDREKEKQDRIIVRSLYSELYGG